MPRTGKIVVIAILAGLMIAVAIVAALRPPREPPVRPVSSARQDADPLAGDLARCRAVTMPDAACEAAWDAHRRRFLGDRTPR